MKKLILATICGIMSVSAVAYDFQEGEIYYNILPDGQSVEVTHNNTADYNGFAAYTGSVTIPESVTYNGVTYNVVKIGEDAFAESTYVSKVTIPESVTEIARKAFYSCSRLRNFELPGSVTSIGELAFYHCVALKSLHIPAAVDAIGSKAFMLCNGLTELTVDAANESYSSENNIIYNKDKTLLVAAMSTFSGHLDVPLTVKGIGENAFVECDGLTSINLGNVSVIHDFAFFDCKGLTTVTLPSSLERLGFGAFFNCTHMSALNMNDNLKEIGERAFTRCIALKDIVFAGDNLKIGNHAFESCKNMNLTDVIDCISEVGDYAFASCVKFRTVTLPRSVKSYGNYAFFACAQMTRLFIGSEVEKMGENVFYNCSRIRQVTIDAMTPPTICKSTFPDVVYRNADLAVPDESLDDYKAAEYWKDFLNIEPSAVASVGADSNIQVVAAGGRLTIVGAQPQACVAVYALDGALVQSACADDIARYTFEGGVYVVKVADKSFKVVL